MGPLEKPNSEHNDAPAPTHSFDGGAAWMSLALQAAERGLVAHAMQGFNAEAARRVLRVPDIYDLPAIIAVGHPGDINVRPHPHIGLSTVTFLFEGEILHRDSLGCVQQIQSGAVNLMTAGRGIVHSERTPVDLERSGQLMHGIQTWMAVLKAGAATIQAIEQSRIMVVGGENVGPRHIWWNFVHSSQQRIDQAKQDWLDGAYDPVPDDDEFIPLPGT